MYATLNIEQQSSRYNPRMGNAVTVISFLVIYWSRGQQVEKITMLGILFKRVFVTHA